MYKYENYSREERREIYKSKVNKNKIKKKYNIKFL